MPISISCEIEPLCIPTFLFLFFFILYSFVILVLKQKLILFIFQSLNVRRWERKLSHKHEKKKSLGGHIMTINMVDFAVNSFYSMRKILFEMFFSIHLAWKTRFGLEKIIFFVRFSIFRPFLGFCGLINCLFEVLIVTIRCL